VQPL